LLPDPTMSINNRDIQKRRDEELLIDFLMGACSAAQTEEVSRRLDSDWEFSELHDDLSNTLAALSLADAPSPPADLVDRTMDYITSQHNLNVLLADEARGRSGGGGAWTFSLREALSVAAAILLLLAAFMPSAVQARRRAEVRQCGLQMGQIGQALNKYAFEHADMLPNAAENSTRWLPSDGEPVVGNSAGLFLLVREGYAEPTIFICPAVMVRGAIPQVDVKMDDFPSADNISFSYQHSLGGQRISLADPKLAGVREYMAILADSNPVFEEGRFIPENIGASSDNHPLKGQNVLYLDMHVQWQETPKAGVEGDDIYLIRKDVDNYRGDEAPADDTDTFLLPAYSKSSSK